MKLTSALTTLVSLTTFANAAPSKFNLLEPRQVSNGTGGAGVGAIGLSSGLSSASVSIKPSGGAGAGAIGLSTGLGSTSVKPTGGAGVGAQATALSSTGSFTTKASGGAGVGAVNTALSSGNGGAGVGAVNTVLSSGTANGGGAGVGAINTNTGLTTTTVTQTLVSTVSQQYTTYQTTEVITATIVISGGSAADPTTNVYTPAGANAAAVNTGTASTVTDTVVVVAGSDSDSTDSCVCSVPVVVATGIYTATVENIVSVNSVVYSTAYPTTVLGVFTVAGGSIVPAVATITQTATVATNTNAALPSGQEYQTITIPATNGSPSVTVVIIVSIVSPVVQPVSSAGSGVGATDTTTTAANGGAGVGAVNTATTAIPFSNVTMTLSGATVAPATATATTTALTGGDGVGAVDASSSVTSAITSASNAAVNVGTAVSATAGQTTDTTAVAAATSAAAATGLVSGTQATAVGDQGTTPLYDQATFINDILSYHNELRARHGAPDLTWNQDLADFALTNANTNAADGTFLHTKDMGLTDPYGENIATQYGYNNPEYLVYVWYDEINSYNYSDPVYSDSTGHFTQVVWDASTELGCAYVQADDANGDYYLTCEYSPPGNYAGEFAANVNEPIVSGSATAPSMYV